MQVSNQRSPENFQEQPGNSQNLSAVEKLAKRILGEELKEDELVSELSKWHFTLKEARSLVSKCALQLWHVEERLTPVLKEAMGIDCALTVHIYDYGAHIKSYDITDQEALVEIAEYIIEHRRHIGLAEINDLGIKDQGTLTRLALRAAATDGFSTSKYLANFGNLTAEERLEVARVAVVESPLGIARFIENYNIEDEKDRVELAKIAAAKEGEELCRHIETFKISDENEKVEVLKIAANQNPEAICEYFAEYRYCRNWFLKLKESARIEIVKIFAPHASEVLIKKFPNFKIKDEDAKVEIALITASVNGLYTSYYIGRFEIKSESSRIQVAMVSAAQNGGATANYIEKYKIDDLAALERIAVTAAAQNGESVVKYIASFLKLSPIVLLKLLKLGLAQDVSKTLDHWYDDRGISSSGLFEASVIGVISDATALNRFHYLGVEGGGEALKKGGDPYQCSASFVVEHPQFAESSFSARFVREAIYMKSPLAKRALLEIAVLKDVDFTTVSCVKDILLLTISKKLPLKNYAFKDAHLLQQLFITARDLLKSSVSTEKTEELLLLALQGNRKMGAQMKLRLRMLSAILSLKGDKKLQLCQNIEEIKTLLQAYFSNIVDLSSVENLVEKFENTFAQFRDSNALFIYLGSLNTLKGSEKALVMNDFSAFVQDVLNGEFLKNRYKDDTPDFWRENQIRKVFLSSSGASFDFPLLLNNAFNDGHLQNELADDLRPYILDPTMEVKKTFTNLQKALILLLREGVEHLDSVRASLQLESPGCELVNDVKSWISACFSKSDKILPYSLEFTDDPSVLLTMGMVGGSCLRVNGNSENNKALVGFIRGEGKLVALKEPSGRLIARAMLRRAKSGAIFIERFYPQVAPQPQVDALLSMAKYVAKAGGVKLYSQEFRGSYSEEVLGFAKGPGTYEYVDALSEICSSDFSIPQRYTCLYLID